MHFRCVFSASFADRIEICPKGKIDSSSRDELLIARPPSSSFVFNAFRALRTLNAKCQPRRTQ
jgi:hypothetical protein